MAATALIVRLTTGNRNAAAYSANLIVGSRTRGFAALTAGADFDPDSLADFPRSPRRRSR